MLEYHIVKAGAIGREAPEDVSIIITGAPASVTPKEAEIFYEHEAMLIVEALFKSLPQGTLDRVLGQMMLRMASLYQGVAGT